VKFALPLALCLAFATTACNTIENRRSFYAPKKADGPYTRSLQDGSWQHPKTVDEQYEEAKRQRAQQGKGAAPAAPQPTVN
jgi:hypothetical protein